MIKNTLELSTGDIICTYGVRLQLTERREYHNGETVAFSTVFAGTVDPDFSPVSMGRYGADMMQGRWVVQGNAYATWNVEA